MNLLKKMLVLFCAQLILCFSAHATPTSHIIQIPESEEDILYQKLEMISEFHKINTIAVYLISENFDIVNFTYSSTSTQHEALTEKRMYAGNISEIFLAIACLHLAQKNKLNLYDPISELLPEVQIKNNWKNAQPIQLINLLEHTSGLPNANRYFKTHISHHAFSNNNTFKGLQTNSPPDFGCNYSDYSYLLLTAILEKTSGTPFEELLNAVIFTPLEMTQTGFKPNAHKNQNKTSSGNKHSTLNVQLSLSSSINPVNSFFTTPSDIKKFLRWLLSEQSLSEKNQILNAFWMEQLRQAHSGVLGNLQAGFGCGPAFCFKEINGLSAYGRQSFSRHHMASVAVIPNANRAWLVIADTPIPKALEEIETLLGIHATQFFKVYFPQEWGADNDFYDSFPGFFKKATHKNRYTAILDNVFAYRRLHEEKDSLYLSGIFAKKQTIIPAGTNVFRKPGEVLPYIFIGDFHNQQVMASHEGVFEKSNAGVIFTRIALVLIVMALSFASLIFAGFKIIKRYFSQRERLCSITPQILILLSAISFLAFLILSVRFPFHLSSFQTFWLWVFRVLSWGIPAFTFLAGYSLMKFSYSFRNRTVFKVYTFSIVIHLFICLWFGYLGVLALNFPT